jgi:hypothetical protein
LVLPFTDIGMGMPFPPSFLIVTQRLSKLPCSVAPARRCCFAQHRLACRVVGENIDNRAGLPNN